VEGLSFFSRVEFFPSVPAKTGLTGSQTGLTGFALWAVEKGF
jgi:hypothetical protein